MNNNPRSAYLHIPFCHRRCFYCDFAVVPLGDKANGVNGPGSNSIKTYLELLHREIALIKEGSPLSTIYFGGGTPSLLTPVQISSLLRHLQQIFGFQDGVEITLEVDPASFDKNSLEEFLEIGINRLSLGGQSFDDDLLLQIGRRHNRKQLIQSCEWIDQMFRIGQLRSWSLDLIQNLPGHDLLFWKSQLLQALEVSAPHLSIYDLSVEPGTVFYRKKLKGELSLPNEDTSIGIDRLTKSLLSEVGYSRYEISNYALPGHASRHNRVYWSGAGWWGFGMGATSAPWGARFSRPRTRDGYEKWLESQEKKGLEPSLEMPNARPIDLDEQLMVGLRRREGVNLFEIGRNWGWSTDKCGEYLDALDLRWKNFYEKGLIIKNGNRTLLTDPEGMEISNQIIVEMFLWWDSLPNDALLPPIS
ncbi:radical SAM family heme chaperone HemW [Prochlorococcus sp. MIT 1223]|uniref:radical SAM family heme chaperone HemW n=1 Tax=Prochlorococcus sp. MIT 1223 TaxID=3096217 RepID=UPI002A766584|nr:radical SAM family heme chaperone HemW [Prochlorococcus sp. MIT 1223]